MTYQIHISYNYSVVVVQFLSVVIIFS